MWEFAGNNPLMFMVIVVLVAAIIGDTISNLKGK